MTRHSARAVRYVMRMNTAHLTIKQRLLLNTREQRVTFISQGLESAHEWHIIIN